DDPVEDDRLPPLIGEAPELDAALERPTPRVDQAIALVVRAGANERPGHQMTPRSPSAVQADPSGPGIPIEFSASTAMSALPPALPSATVATLEGLVIWPMLIATRASATSRIRRWSPEWG